MGTWSVAAPWKHSSAYSLVVIMNFAAIVPIDLRPTNHFHSSFLLPKDDDLSSSWWMDVADGKVMKSTLETISSSISNHNHNAPDLRRVFLKNTSVTCNDGSRSGYYIRKYPGSKTWLIFLEGGWYCFDSNSCDSRWMHSRSLMSSKTWQEHHIASGILSPDAEENPLFWNTNIVYVPYCSSDVWTGITSAKSTKQKFSFMGALILREVVRALLPRGLLKARKVLLAGSSAGATGVMLNVDRIAEQLRDEGCKAEVRGLMDSGWFLESEPFRTVDCVDPRRCSPIESVKKGIKLWNGDIPDRCRKLYRHEPWKCYFGFKLYPVIQTPLFVFQWLYDEAQLMAANVFVPRTKAHGTYVQTLRQTMVDSLNNISAVFAPSCVGHVVLTEKLWSQYSVNHVTFGSALRCWWEKRGSGGRLHSTPSNSVRMNEMPDMLSDQPTSPPLSCKEQLRKCRLRRKKRRQLNTSGSTNARKKRCRCHSENNVVDKMNRKSLRAQRNKRRAGLPAHMQNFGTKFCSSHVIDRCSLPNCNQYCPKNYDTFSAQPITFEQMLRNAGVSGEDPIGEVFL
ncbi:carboxylesterase notum2-like [Paramacrobiotus metropolitanus]|uniref:carboxylesterase notum2-like n=1 Tax=Paramacrobiotus metropolitanus TaxID=2943436 RepID=UPI0024464870|nr:carboxylesterase notum2-like [Paramacrobiotus metropolitanus]